MVIEELMQSENPMCFNDGSGTRINIRTGTESAVDLTFVSNSLATTCWLEVVKEMTEGSDHYAVLTKTGLNRKL